MEREGRYDEIKLGDGYMSLKYSPNLSVRDITLNDKNYAEIRMPTGVLIAQRERGVFTNQYSWYREPEAGDLVKLRLYCPLFALPPDK